MTPDHNEAGPEALRARAAQAIASQSQSTVTVLSSLLAVEEELGYIPKEAVEGRCRVHPLHNQRCVGCGVLLSQLPFQPTQPLPSGDLLGHVVPYHGCIAHRAGGHAGTGAGGRGGYRGRRVRASFQHMLGGVRPSAGCERGASVEGAVDPGPDGTDASRPPPRCARPGPWLGNIATS